MIDDTEATQLSDSDDLKVKAEKFLLEEQKRNHELGLKANQAIEDAIIARHQATTGRKFRTREENLKDANEWNARVEAEKREKVEGAIEKAIVDTENARAKAAKPTQANNTISVPKPGLLQRTVNFANKLLGRK